MEFGDRLRRIRTAQGLSLREFARRVGVSGSYISQLEGNECRPSFSVLKRIAEELGTAVSVLTEDHLPEEWVVVRQKDRRRIVVDDPAFEVEYVAFTGHRDKSMQSCFVRLKPGADGPNPVFTHDREDMICHRRNRGDPVRRKRVPALQGRSGLLQLPEPRVFQESRSG